MFLFEVRNLVLLDLFLNFRLLVSVSLKTKNVLDWLIQNNQNSNSIKMFWEILGVGALNTILKSLGTHILQYPSCRYFLKVTPHPLIFFLNMD
jgi:hypothetical protein